MSEPIYIDSDNLLTVSGLRDTTQSSDTYINNATVTCTLKDKSGNDVSGQTWPLSLGYITGSDGVYRGVLEDGLALSPDVNYTAHINIDAGSDMILNIRKAYFSAYKS